MATNFKNDRSPWLWVWVAGAFLVMFIAWAVMFNIASKNRVAEVPLATHPAH